MRGVVLCEYSGTVSKAFRDVGIECWSCDILPTEGDPQWHLQEDAIEVAYGTRWDFAIMHPPCTDLAVSGARHFPIKRADGRQRASLDFVQKLLDAPIECKALENTISIISTEIEYPTQIIDPTMFGHRANKKTCLWLRKFPKLVATDIVKPDYARKADGSLYLNKNGKPITQIHFMGGKNRAHERSRTYAGIAKAMAEQWGAFLRGGYDL